jgi:hypothetical protein
MLQLIDQDLQPIDINKEVPHDFKAPWKIGDVVFIKSILGEDDIPSKVINKPQIVIHCWRVPLNHGEPPLWDVTVIDQATGDEFEQIIFHTDLTKEKPFP